ncbi:MAG: hypothetical protein OXM01_05675, partial [Gemmatimonadota bacterium]|nr:hypothetical protein [Gemmatimonadota bacterium]
VQRIYDEANAYADLNGGVPHGMNVLYGPPILAAKVMVVSIQGGGRDGKRPQTTWPFELAYLNQEHPFGARLVEDFQSAGLFDTLSHSTVATNIAFPQAPDFNQWRKRPDARAWLEKSTAWVQELIRLLRPVVILTYGSPPFFRLVGRAKRGMVEQTKLNGVPLVACDHFASRRLTRDARADAVARVKRLI